MKIRHAKSHFTKKCVVCDKHTHATKIYEEGGISIRVPVCDRDESDCQTKVFIKDMAKDMLRQLKMGVAQ